MQSYSAIYIILYNLNYDMSQPDDRDNRRFGLKFTKSVDRFFNSIDFKGLEIIQKKGSPEKGSGGKGFRETGKIHKINEMQ